MSWLKKFTLQKSWENKVGLAEQPLALLVKDFARVASVDAQLPERMLRYALDGEDEGVLTDLAAKTGVGEALALLSLSAQPVPGHEEPRRRFFDCVRCAEPRFFVRLGQIYEAASQRGRTIQMAGRTHNAPRRIFQYFQDARLNWLNLLLSEALGATPDCHVQFRKSEALTAELVEQMLASEGHSPALWVSALFDWASGWFAGSVAALFNALPGSNASLVRHRDAVLAALARPDLKQRGVALDMLQKLGAPPEPFVDTLIELGVSSSKQMREGAEALLRKDPEAARPGLEAKAIQGETEERVNALRLLWRLRGEAGRTFLEQRAAEDQSRKVVSVLEEILAAPAQSAGTACGELPSLPPPMPVEAHAPLGPETLQALHACFDEVNAAIRAGQKSGGAVVYSRAGRPSGISREAVEQGFGLMEDLVLGPTETSPNPGVVRGLVSALTNRITGTVSPPEAGLLGPSVWTEPAWKPIRAFLTRPELQVIHALRFLYLVGVINPRHNRPYYILGFWFDRLLSHYRKHHPGFGLRELAENLRVFGLNPRLLADHRLSSSEWTGASFCWEPEAVWPYFSEHLEPLAQAFAPGSDFMARYERRNQRRNAFEVLRLFPQPPPSLLPVIWDLALGPKSDRKAAQACVRNLPDLYDRLAAALAGNNAESRGAAAEWLAELKETKAINPLLGAMKKERTEATKGAMMLALERLGVPVEQFLARDSLLKEAQKLVVKGVPDDLQWFPFGQLPVVHWADNGEAVEPVILKLWLLQGFKLKSPEPGPLLRSYCARMVASERAGLGQFVLEAWLAQDVSPRTGAIAEKEARQRAQQELQQAQHMAQYIKQNPQFAQQFGRVPPPKTLDEYYQEILPKVLLEPTGSAIASKGILSLAGACVGAEAAPVVNRYLKQWYGMRAAQCRALLQMLAWVEHKSATQLLLAVGSRFRTKGIQDEATQQAQALAERKGWSVAELADRTIPTAGLDEQGVLTLDFGARQFTARLNDKHELALADGEGKLLKSLPEPRKDDDEAKAAEAKKTFAAAKKELKSVLAMQRDRFYEAMCTQRNWPFDDWNTYLNTHPIVRRYCQRLVWCLVREGKPGALFRPLADGSLTDAGDEPVKLEAEDRIVVAHECQVTPEQSLAWRTHLKDYEVEPLFEQFGQPHFALPEERKAEESLADFRGHLLEAFKLRGRATKLGYTRGQAQDGGWFYTYHKRFPRLGLEAVIEFTGNGLPEENRTVALTTLHFDRVAAEGEGGMNAGSMVLSEVPGVLLSECWNDLRQIAGEGPGFDADWEKKAIP